MNFQFENTLLQYRYLKKIIIRYLDRKEPKWSSGWWYYLLLFCFNKPTIQARMLKKTNCSLYDAEFSMIHQNMRFLAGQIEPILYQINLRECLTKCVVHATCLSVNYFKSNETWILNIGFHRLSSMILNQVFGVASGWVHYNTKEKKAVSRNLWRYLKKIRWRKYYATTKICHPLLWWRLFVKFSIKLLQKELC